MICGEDKRHGEKKVRAKKTLGGRRVGRERETMAGEVGEGGVWRDGGGLGSDEIIARLVVCCHPAQIASYTPSSSSSECGCLFSSV